MHKLRQLSAYRIIHLIGLVVFANSLPAQSDIAPLMMTENKGQFADHISHYARLVGGNVFFENDGLTFGLIHPEDWDAHFGHHHHDTGHVPSRFRSHGLKWSFQGANSTPQIQASRPFQGVKNFFRGADPGRWASGCRSFAALTYRDLYPDVAMHISELDGHIWYRFHLFPGADPRCIRWSHSGADAVFLRGDTLVVSTTVGEIKHTPPQAWFESSGRAVGVRFVIDGAMVRLVPEVSGKLKETLIIDPKIVFASYTGSSADNFGFTATYDTTGALYGGGTVFGDGIYPTTFGAYDQAHDSLVDVGLTKFNAVGTNLIYSTLLGGHGAESPSSCVVNSKNQLVVYGMTSSSDFPTTNGAYDRTFNGGTPVNLSSNGTDFHQGTDLFITVMNANGMALVGSTYIGGSANDGLNTLLRSNYGDQFRGEVMVDDQDRIHVATTTFSTNFPMAGGGFQPVHGGNQKQDAVIFRMNPTVTQLQWSTFFGQTNDDAAYSITQAGNGDLYIAGGTKDVAMATTNGAWQATTPGGNRSGFILCLNAAGTIKKALTYVGSAARDQIYFVRTDSKDDVWAYGQNGAAFPVTAGVYSKPNSGQFIIKLDPNLTTNLVSTVFGRGDGDPELSPSAFLVDDCDNIYVAGWGGETNDAIMGHIGGLDVTADAFSKTTDSSDFYFMVLSPDAKQLVYATYFGGSASTDHVDGGTSRFDAAGRIYQAVCSSCGAPNSDFPTTTGAWSSTDNSNQRCNLGVVKFELQLLKPKAKAGVAASTIGCLPFDVQFDNQTIGGQNYTWYFGDGDSSTDENPLHTFDSVGVFSVMLVATDTSLCRGGDTAYISIEVRDDTVSAAAYGVALDSVACDGLHLDLVGLSPGATHSWDFGDTVLSGAAISRILPNGNHTVTLIVTDTNKCHPHDTLSFPVQAVIDTVVASFTYVEQASCDSVAVQFTGVSNGKSVLWDFGTGDTSHQLSPNYTYDTTGFYDIVMYAFDSTSCNKVDSQKARVRIALNRASAFAEDSFDINCDSVTGYFNFVGQGDSIVWDFGNGDTSQQRQVAYAWTVPGSYTVKLLAIDTFACVPRDSLLRKVVVTDSMLVAKINVAQEIRCDSFLVDLSTDSLPGIWWHLPGPDSSNLDSLRVGYDQPGVYTFRLIVEDSATCNLRDTVVQLLSYNQDSLVAAGGFDLDIADGCDSIVVTMTDTSQFAGTSTWEITGGIVLNGSPQTVTFDKPGTYLIRLIATNLNTCNDVDTLIQEVIVKDDVDAGPLPPDTVCRDDLVAFNYNGRSATDFTWSFGDGDSAFVASPSHVYQDLGTFKVTLLVEDSVCNEVDSVQSTVKVYDRITTAFITNPVSPLPTFGEIEFINQSQGDADWFWSFGDGTTSTEENPRHAYNEPGIYTVCLVGKNFRECEDSTCIEVEVILSGLVEVPTGFSPNGDGINDIYFARGYGVERLDLRIYDRWGVLMFVSDDLKVGWDGTYKGVPQEMEVYIYVLDATLVTGEDVLEKGNVTLIR